MRNKSFLSVLLLTLIVSLSYALSVNIDPQFLKKSKTTEIDTLFTNSEGEGSSLEIYIEKGPEHNHPLMAIWIEDAEGIFVQTLYVSQSIATGTFNYGETSDGRWQRGPKRRPAALPYWSHQRGIQAEDGLYTPSPENPVADAYSGPTPKNDVQLKTILNEELYGEYFVLLEVNQPWDWNEYWTNGKYPGNEEYASSAQPSVVYRGLVDFNEPNLVVKMAPFGHGHYAGENGNLNKDLSSLTTALHIIKSATINVIKGNK